MILTSGSHFIYIGDEHELFSAENKNMETPIHEACRQENVNVLMLLLKVNSMAACKVIPTGKSDFFVACFHGQACYLDLVNLSKTVGLEVAGFDQVCFHIAASRGDSNVVRELLNKWPDLTQLIDENGNLTFHHACNKGHREIVLFILKRDSNLALLYNNNGYTPLHLAVINGKVSVLNDFVSCSYDSFHCLTRKEETLFHLAVRYRCYDALVLLMQSATGINLLHCQDRWELMRSYGDLYVFCYCFISGVFLFIVWDPGKINVAITI
ncbi:ankyrin repeat-containing protein At5g02620-like [Vicia villosa]|uniref:ankyrin repeat-containing protein At5g02620-like n=1 Tax=Vicia villosa TaxID=3911 RepID=UPI00273CEF34|nr:ankyrin repeat-containing protein At5g02620-like [Vicia villosa]